MSTVRQYVPGGPPQVSVDGQVIAESEIAREMQHHRAETLGASRHAAAVALVVRALLLNEAERLDINANANEREGEPAEDARIRVLLEREVACPEPDEAACRRWFEAHPERMRTPDAHEVSHILLPAPPDDAEVRADARTRARSLTETLQAAPSRFATLAGEHSSCPSRDAGGHLGVVTGRETVPEFARALSRLPVGEVPEHPVETRYGFHVVLVHARYEGRPLEFDACRERIADYLREHVRRKAISQYIRILAGRASITGIDLGGADSPLVQ